MTTICEIAGNQYGHVPGHNYHDVTVECDPDGSNAFATEVWGSAQGYDEEHGRNEISAESLGELMAAAKDADWDDSARKHLATAIAMCRRVMQ